jgi:hypothetical protein
MADMKVSGDPAATTVLGTDLASIVTDPGGTPTSKKITFLNLINSLVSIVTAIPSFNGVKFPAIQVPSADANTLDDYEEGTWTPTGNGITLTITSALYTKVGNVVHLFLDCTFPSTASGSPAHITGLPFEPAVNGAVSLGYTTDTTALCIGVSSLGYILIMQPGGTERTNAQCSTLRYIMSGAYSV